MCEFRKKARVEVMRKLERYEPTVLRKQRCSLNLNIEDKNTSYGKADIGFVTPDLHHYPFVIDADGTPWSDANRYLLSRLDSVVPAKYRTLESIASDLVCFKNWLNKEEIDYFRIPSRPRATPTFRYCAYLHDEITSEKIQPSTAKRRMNSVQNFYRWLISDGHDFKNPLWREKNVTLLVRDSQGFQLQKSVLSTELTRSFKAPKKNDDYGDCINDGGQLRPLPNDEQKALVESLKRIGNTEMLLAFMISLTTGARLQTAFTFRKKHFEFEPRDNTVVYRLKAGKGTLIDTKFGKQIVLLIPVWLYYRIQIYLRSDRYLVRASRSKHVYENSNEQYLFLTRVGAPYYIAENDPFCALYRSPPRGNSVTQFIRQQLKPDLIKCGHDFTFRFHDLRATFGMNLLEDRLENLEPGQFNDNQPDFFDMLIYVKERMGHSKLSTTEGYLNYRKKYHLAAYIQTKFEQYLQDMCTAVEGDDGLV